MSDNKKIKMVLNGALGRMGGYVLDAVLDTNDIEIIHGVDPAVTDTTNNYKGVNLVPDIESVLNEDVDVVLDFTNSEVTMDIVNKCRDNNVDLIIGSTGFTQAQINELKDIATNSNITVFLVPNFSIGANLLMKAVENISNYYDYVDVTEMHHENKVDSPSGTAMSIAESISRGKKSGKFMQNIPERESVKNARGANYEGINIHSRRMPGYVAHHEVVFGSLGETLTLRHDSIDRKSFMQGVIESIRSIHTLNGFVYGLDNIL